MHKLLTFGLVLALALAGCTTPATQAPTVTPPQPTLEPTVPPPTEAPTEAPPTPTEVAATEAPQATDTPAATPTPAPTDTPAASPTPSIVYITFRDFEILPRQVTIKVGTTVVFLIEGGLLSFHQPYNFNPPNVFEAPSNLGNGTSYSYTFTEPGTINIRCGYHQEMIGTLVIEP